MAQVLDLCSTYAGRDDARDLRRLVRLFAASVKAPLMIDSTAKKVLDRGFLKTFANGKAQ